MFHRSARGHRDRDRKGGKPKSFVSLLLVTALLLASQAIARGQQKKQADMNKQLVQAVASLDVEQTRQCLHDGADPNLLVGVSLSMHPEKGPRQFYHYPVKPKSMRGTTLLRGALSHDVLTHADESKAKQQGIQIALLLIEAGADPNCPNDPRNKPYSRKRYQSRRYTNPADIYWSPLYQAASLQLPQVVQALLDHGANVNPNGEAPLSTAAGREDNRIALTLLAHGANPNCQTDAGFTPLMAAVPRHDVVLVRALLAKGADLALKEWSGETALDIARRFKDREMVTLLTQHAKSKKKRSSKAARNEQKEGTCGR